METYAVFETDCAQANRHLFISNLLDIVHPYGRVLAPY